MGKATILTIDDEPNLQLVVQHYLEDDGYRVIQAHSGKELSALLADKPEFDVVLLDLNLPDVEGLSLIPKLREYNAAPIIIVSGKSDTTEKVVGLELGASDYMTKPFEMRELSARIKVCLRNNNGTSKKEDTDNNLKNIDRVIFNDWCLDRQQYQLFDSKQQSADLTTGEFKLLEALVLSPNRALSREYLFDLTRDGEFDAYDRAIDIQIARLRKKIRDDSKSPKLIKTIRGVGYMFAGETKVA